MTFRKLLGAFKYWGCSMFLLNKTKQKKKCYTFGIKVWKCCYWFMWCNMHAQHWDVVEATRATVLWEAYFVNWTLACSERYCRCNSSDWFDVVRHKHLLSCDTVLQPPENQSRSQRHYHQYFRNALQIWSRYTVCHSEAKHPHIVQQHNRFLPMAGGQCKVSICVTCQNKAIDLKSMTQFVHFRKLGLLIILFEPHTSNSNASFIIVFAKN